jgi:hypothetical protein
LPSIESGDALPQLGKTLRIGIMISLLDVGGSEIEQGNIEERFAKRQHDRVVTGALQVIDGLIDTDGDGIRYLLNRS